MSCPLCHAKCMTIDTHGYLHIEAVRRRRECRMCGHRFSTIESIAVMTDIVVRKSNAHGKKAEPFDIDKLKRSLNLALNKRNINQDRINRIAWGIHQQLDIVAADLDHKPKLGEYNEVKSSYIGQLVLESLKVNDWVAYIRYASVFHRFGHVDDFLNCIEQLSKVRTD